MDRCPWAEPLVARATTQPRPAETGEIKIKIKFKCFTAGRARRAQRPRPCHRVSQRWGIPNTRGTSRAGGTRHGDTPGSVATAAALRSGFHPGAGAASRPRDPS